MSHSRVLTIGFTRTTAQHFFGRLGKAGVKKVVDVRLHNTSQLAGFAKADDLAYFLGKIGGMEYVHAPLLAPTEDMLNDYRKRNCDWARYETRFRALMAERRIEDHYTPDMLDHCCLLCSEHDTEHCHRRLVCEYLNERWNGALSVQHL
jgi:uncharacterized protein (DUF488 family)